MNKMITELELGRIDKLREDLNQVKSILNSMSNNTITTKIGLVSFYSHAPYSPKTSEEYASWAVINMKATMERLNQTFRSELEHLKKEIELELSRYITRDS